jgi:hypothetical protein
MHHNVLKTENWSSSTNVGTRFFTNHPNRPLVLHALITEFNDMPVVNFLSKIANYLKAASRIHYMIHNGNLLWKHSFHCKP